MEKVYGYAATGGVDTMRNLIIDAFAAPVIYMQRNGQVAFG